MPVCRSPAPVSLKASSWGSAQRWRPTQRLAVTRMCVSTGEHLICVVSYSTIFPANIQRSKALCGTSVLYWMPEMEETPFIS